MKINIQKKVDGQLLNANEVNQIADAVNEIDDEAKRPSHAFFEGDFIVDGTTNVGSTSVPVIKINPARVSPPGQGGGSMTKEEILTTVGVWPVNQLPEATLSSEQFEVLPNGSIGIRTDYLLSVVGGTPLPSLAASVLSANVPSSSQINLTWIAVTNATAYVLQRGLQADFSDAATIYTGGNLSFNATGLNASTNYKFRVKCTASGYRDSAWASISATTAAPGTVVPAGPTNFIVDNTAHTANWTVDPAYPDLSDYEQTLDGGITTNTVASKPINLGLVAKAKGKVGVRVKASGGRQASAWLYNPQAFTTSSGPYAVENSYYLNFANMYGPVPDNPPPYWNTFKPDESLLSVANGFTSPIIFNTANVVSNPAIRLKNTGTFSGTTTGIAPEQDNAGDTGALPNDIINTAWKFNNSTKLKIEGLNPAKFYQFKVIMPVRNAPSVRGVTIAGVQQTRNATSVLPSFGSAANGLNDPEYVVFNDITGTEVEAIFNRISGDNDGFISNIILEQTNINKL